MSKQWLDWFDWDNEKDCIWALGYLFKAGETVPAIGIPRERLSALLQNWPQRMPHRFSTPDDFYSARRALETKMYMAYSQRKKREAQRDHKTYNLIMKKSASPKLRYLASKWDMTFSQVVERLIFWAEDIQKELTKDSRKAISEARERFKNQETELRKKLAERDSHIKELKKEIHSLKNPVVKREVINRTLKAYKPENEREG